TANGSGAAPDVFEIYGKPGDDRKLSSNIPIPDLNVRIRKSLPIGISASLSVKNILDYSIIQYQKDNGQYFTTSALNPGRSFSLSITYNID
ncbi:MAG: hypothetical protein WD098_00720, partial [Balneolales bacterium]